MHPVLGHILARKGKSVPVNDGRKIALVLFGGIMSGIRGGGALIGLEELGLRYALDSVYVISAGFPNIAYFLDNKVRLATSIYYNDLSGQQFIDPWRLKKIVDIDYLNFSVWSEAARNGERLVVQNKYIRRCDEYFKKGNRIFGNPLAYKRESV